MLLQLNQCDNCKRYSDNDEKENGIQIIKPITNSLFLITRNNNSVCIDNNYYFCCFHCFKEFFKKRLLKEK